MAQVVRIFLLVVLLGWSADRLLAGDRLVPVQFNFSATLYAQNTQSSTNGTRITTGPTIAFQVTPASLLKNLARAKYATGDYPSINFPAGAKLFWLVNLDTPAQSHFAVLQTNGTLVADVSDLITFEGDGNPGTFKGSEDSSNGTLSRAAYAYMATIRYDDTTTPGGNLKYYLTGLYADRENDTIDSLNKTFTRTIYMQSLCVSGSGSINGLNLSGGGTAFGNGKATLPLP